MSRSVRKLGVGIGIASLFLSTVIAVFSVFGILPKAWLEPTLLSLLATAAGGVFVYFAVYLDDHHFHGMRAESISGLRIALGAAAAFAIVSFFEGVV